MGFNPNVEKLMMPINRIIQLTMYKTLTLKLQNIIWRIDLTVIIELNLSM